MADRDAWPVPGPAVLATESSVTASLFYAGLFGWTFEPDSSEGIALALDESGDVAAVVWEAGSGSGWRPHFACSAESLGGTSPGKPVGPLPWQKFRDAGGNGSIMLSDGSSTKLPWVARGWTSPFYELSSPRSRWSFEEYAALLGARAVVVPDDPGAYSLLIADDRLLAGFFATDVFGAPPVVEGWIPYFPVADVDSVVALALELGGDVVFPADDYAIGRSAALASPTGEIVGVGSPISEEALSLLIGIRVRHGVVHASLGII